jgi:hypothetical protein
MEREKPLSVSGSITDFSRDTVSKVRDSFGDMGRGIFDQLVGNYDLQPEKNSPEHSSENTHEEEKPSVKLEGGNLFNYRRIEEDRQMHEIKELIKQIKQEVEMIKKADKALMSEVQDVEGIAINSIPENAGIYHLRFLQLVLKVLELVRAKLGESKTWMQAFMSKKAKRGSAFATRSKKAGTSYSMSQELSNSRSVQ